MDELLELFLFFVVLVAIVAFLIWMMVRTVRKDNEETLRFQRDLAKEQELQRQEEEERKRQEARKRQEEIERKRREEEERKRREEEERKRNTFCCICGKCSMGLDICQNCFDRSEVLGEELPKPKIKNYEAVCQFYQETINKAVFADSKKDREFQSIRLIAITELLKQKYFVEDATDETRAFLMDFKKEEYQATETIVSKYTSKKVVEEDETEETEDEDYRNKHDKPYRCEDGDYVRSKAEREIDDFFFKNRIWHEYEATYVHSETNQKYYPDFYLPDHNLYLEYFGLNTPEYVEKRDSKIQMYRSDSSIRFEYLTYEDDSNIYERLKDICIKHNIPLK